MARKPELQQIKDAQGNFVIGVGETVDEPYFVYDSYCYTKRCKQSTVDKKVAEVKKLRANHKYSKADRIARRFVATLRYKKDAFNELAEEDILVHYRACMQDLKEKLFGYTEVTQKDLQREEKEKEEPQGQKKLER